jgi:N-acetylmuramoyl-L-alanine amidase
VTNSRRTSWIAWTGIVLIAASVIWFEFLPRRDRLPESDRRPTVADGPIRRVIIDAGHGGQDSGAIRNGVLEKDLTLDVARKLDRLLRAQGLETVLTRAGDETVSLAGRAEIANRERDSIFVSIHFDEGGRAAATGVQTFYAARQVPAESGIRSWLPFWQRVSSEPTNLESQSLAGFVQQAMVARTQAFDRGTRAQQFYVVANVRHPAVLVEGGFLSNTDDIAKLQSEAYREQLARAISEGIARYREVAGQRRQTLAVAEPGT